MEVRKLGVIQVFLLLQFIKFRNKISWEKPMGFLKSLFIGSSEVPSIENEEQVIDWFFENDKLLKNFKRVFPANVEGVKKDILDDLEKNNDAKSLGKFVSGATKFWEETAGPQALLRSQGPIEGESHQEFIYIIYGENYLSAKLRILGYFLLKK